MSRALADQRSNLSAKLREMRVSAVCELPSRSASCTILLNLVRVLVQRYSYTKKIIDPTEVCWEELQLQPLIETT